MIFDSSTCSHGSGMTMIINDDLTGMVLNFAVFCSAMLVGLFSLFFSGGALGQLSSTPIVSDPSNIQMYMFIVFVFAAFMGGCCTLVVVQVVNSIIATIYVCFATHPDDLANFPEGKDLHDNLKARMAALGEAGCQWGQGQA